MDKSYFGEKGLMVDKSIILIPIGTGHTKVVEVKLSC